MERRAYSVLAIKAVDEAQRIIEGIASTPSTDRMGDVVEPKGATFSLPVPFLWQHNHDKPIGHVERASVSDKGIKVRIRVEQDDEPGPLKDLLDLAWRSIKKGLVRGLSIGFRPTEDPEPIKGTYGLRFTAWELLELSAVTVPANAEATITTIKSIDTEIRAASGNGSRSFSSPGASGIRIHRKSNPEGDTMLTIEQNLENLEAQRLKAEQRMEAIAKTAADENRTKNEAEREEYDTLRDDVAALDVEIKDAEDLIRIQSRAKPVDGTDTKAAGASRDTRVVVKHPDKPEKGIEFARFVMCMAGAKGDTGKALRLAKTHYPHMHRILNVLKAADGGGSDVHNMIARMAEIRTKGAVAAGTTAGETWAGPLLEYTQFSGDFIEYLRPRTIIGQIGDRLRRIPFNVHIRSQTSGGSASWVGQGKPKPVTKFDYLDAYHGFYKVSAISVITEELIRFSDPNAEMLVRDGLADAVIARIDTDFVDPTKEAASGVSPASITNGVTAITSSGDTADALRADLLSLWAAAIAANLPLQSAVYITTPSIAMATSLLMNLDGQPEFPGMSVNGGALNGIPVIVSNYVPAGTFILAFGSEIYLSDDGVVTVDASREASIEMLDSALQQDAGAGTGASLVSMYQTNSVALRAERYINWSKRRTTAVALLEDVGWGGAVSS